MYPSHHSQDSSAEESFPLLILRGCVAIAICCFQLIPEAVSGWKAIWNEKAWPLAEFVAGFGVPQSQWVLTAVLVVAFLAVGGMVFGFLTRISAILLLAGAGVSGFAAVKEESVAGLELSIVYGLVLLFFLLRGAGAFSGDQFFANRRGE